MTSSTNTRTPLGGVRGRWADDAGWAGDVIAYPAVILFVLVLLQFGLYYVATTAAQSAADNAYQQARGYHATTADGVQAGDATLAANPTLLRAGVVDVTRSTDTVTTTVTGQAISLVPALPMPPVHVTLSGPVERWVPAP